MGFQVPESRHLLPKRAFPALHACRLRENSQCFRTEATVIEHVTPFAATARFIAFYRR